LTYLEKAEKISVEDREFVRGELSWIAERLLQSYPDMTFREINRYLRQMLNVSV